jgi:hypothetical protein
MSMQLTDFVSGLLPDSRNKIAIYCFMNTATWLQQTIIIIGLKVSRTCVIINVTKQSIVKFVKDSPLAWVRCFVGKISRTLFLIRDSPASLPDGSGCSIRMIRIVLRQQPSHLFLIRTNIGYGTVLTAACARKGCSATHPLILFLECCNSVLHINFYRQMDLRVLTLKSGVDAVNSF